MQLAVPRIHFSFDLDYCLNNKAPKLFSVYVAAHDFPFGHYKIACALEDFLARNNKLHDFEFRGYEHIWRSDYLPPVKREQLHSNGWMILSYDQVFKRPILRHVNKDELPLFDLTGIATVIQGVSQDFYLLKNWLQHMVREASENPDLRASLVERYLYEVGHMLTKRYEYVLQNRWLWRPPQQTRLHYGHNTVHLIHGTPGHVYEIWFDLQDLGFVIRCPEKLLTALKNNFGPFVTNFLGDN
jgi:hypothetical protein|uniref:Uncharacterized protein n=1 Tax=Myoviridae sp. ctshb19 TaxID=2825194 RepID=A0A8S5UGI7_9CAUD|nr:MAG TPA: hypothetical protein [Myoviridae sp. ctshb19]